jgi:hypothetical protein
MNASLVRNDISNTPKSRKKQAIATTNPVGLRIIECMGQKDYAWLSAQTGIPATTLSNYVHRGIASTDNALKLAQCFDVTVDWLLTGGVRGRTPAVVSVEDSDWIDVPEHDLRELDDTQRGPVVSVTPFRRDWLNRTLGYSTGLWIARLPTDLPRFSLGEGDPVFLRELEPGEAQDGAIYIVRIWGHLTVARLDSLLSASMSPVESNLAERRIGFRDLGTEDGKAVLVARVLGAPLRKL